MLINNPPDRVDWIKAVSGEILKPKILEIGDWNMDTTGSVNVNHGLTEGKKYIVSCDVFIRDDTSTFMNRCPVLNNDCYIDAITNTFIGLTRTAGGTFDNNSYDATTFNRGWIILWYVDTALW